MSFEILKQHKSFDYHFLLLVLVFSVEETYNIVLGFVQLSLIDCFLFSLYFQVTEQKNKGEQHCDKCTMLSMVKSSDWQYLLISYLFNVVLVLETVSNAVTNWVFVILILN